MSLSVKLVLSLNFTVMWASSTSFCLNQFEYVFCLLLSKWKFCLTCIGTQRWNYLILLRKKFHRSKSPAERQRMNRSWTDRQGRKSLPGRRISITNTEVRRAMSYYFSFLQQMLPFQCFMTQVFFLPLIKIRYFYKRNGDMLNWYENKLLNL